MDGGREGWMNEWMRREEGRRAKGEVRGGWELIKKAFWHLLPLFQLPTLDFVEVKECVRSKSEEIDRRFCFEVELSTTVGK